MVLPDPPDPADTHFHAIGGKILLQSFRATGLAGPFVGSLYLDFEPSFLLRPF